MILYRIFQSLSNTKLKILCKGVRNYNQIFIKNHLKIKYEVPKKYKKFGEDLKLKFTFVVKKGTKNVHPIYSCLLLGSSAVILYKFCVGSLFVKCHSNDACLSEDLLGDETRKEEVLFDWYLFWLLLKPQLHYFIAAVIVALYVSICNIKIPLLLGDIVNVIIKYSQNASNTNSNFIQEIIHPTLNIVKVYGEHALGTFLYIFCLSRMGERMACNLRQALFERYLRLDIAFYDEHKTGELLNRLTSDVQDFKSSFKMFVAQGLRSTTQIIGCGYSLFLISPEMAGLAAVLIPSVIAVGTVTGSVLRGISKSAQHQVGVATAVAEESLSNIRTVRAFAMERQEAKEYKKELEKSCYYHELLGTGIGIFQAGSNFFLNAVVLGTLYAGGTLISSGQLKPGDLTSFLVSAQTIQKSLAQLSIMFGSYVRGVTAGARVFEYINKSCIIPITGGHIIPYHAFYGAIEFKDVTFIYPTRPDQTVLDDFNMTIPCGKVVAIVGASGEGKSTIAQLVERFYDVNEGQITIDGLDIRTLDPSWLRSKVIGYINQEPILLQTSILENIRYGWPAATDEEVHKAAQVANAHDFIMEFPDKYETVVGERGVTVSGGQKQRIAIARALVKNPSILILDEATSALDAESEAIVQKALDSCIQGRTVIVIAHRLSTIQNADEIVVISNGKIAETGSHSSLKKKKGGIYAELIKQQQS